MLAVLDTMKQPVPEPDTYMLYYHILDADQNGRAPNCPGFDSSQKSCLHKIAKTNNKVMQALFLMAFALNCLHVFRR